MVETVELICKECNAKFIVHILRKESAKFCNIKCYANWASKNRRGENHPNFNINSKIRVICKYCKQEYNIYKYKKNRSNFCSVKCLHNWQSEFMVKKKRYNYKGGYSKRRKEGYFLQKYRNWRSSVFERDMYTCQECGKMGCYIEAHHIFSWKDYPELRFNLDNGKTLCLQCHKQKHKRGD